MMWRSEGAVRVSALPVQQQPETKRKNRPAQDAQYGREANAARGDQAVSPSGKVPGIGVGRRNQWLRRLPQQLDKMRIGVGNPSRPPPIGRRQPVRNLSVALQLASHSRFLSKNSRTYEDNRVLTKGTPVMVPV